MNTELNKWLNYIEKHFTEKPEWFSINYIRDGMDYTITHDYRTSESTEEWHPVVL